MEIVSVSDVRNLARAQRREQGLTQAQLADRAGVGRQWISEFENGGSGTDLALVLRLFAALGTSLHALPRGSTAAEAEVDDRLTDLDAHLRGFGGWPTVGIGGWPDPAQTGGVV